MKQILSGLLLLVIAAGFTIATRTITGTVTDEKGNFLSGATVMIKGSSKAATTGMDGKFSIAIAEKESTLQISLVGYETTEIKIGKDNNYLVKLKPVPDQSLQELILTGRTVGTEIKQRKEITGSVASSGPTPVGATLQGQVAGLNQMAAPPPVTYGYGAGDRHFDREGYDHISENGFKTVSDNPLSTFSIDVDAASYSNVRRILNSGQLPQQGAVRIEEMINYFRYDYAQPKGNDPFAVHMELGVCPWNSKHQLALIGLQGRKIDMEKLPPSNLVFLIDVSGSMWSADKLPLVKQSLKLLTEQLREEDMISMVVYAGKAGRVLEPTSGDQKMRIIEAIEKLEAGGSTAGGAGIKLAYQTAKENFIANGNNRVILCTDGDFNVGLSSDDALERMIEQERKSGVFLSVLGFGTGNYQDAKMQKLADKGNGNHSYIDQLSEAKKVLVSEFGGTLFTIAKDVKLQVEFNPAKIKGYRLIGYENRMLAKEDFNDDKKDAGELGSGHTVTALYELVPVGVDMPESGAVDPLRYQAPITAISKDKQMLADEVMNVKLRYKQPDGDKSSLLSFALKANPKPVAQLSDNFRFAAAVAGFGMLLRNSPFKGNSNYESVSALAKNAMGKDAEGYRKEFLQLVDKALKIQHKDVAIVE
jgi:Ca-activated chloride channel family protein